MIENKKQPIANARNKEPNPTVEDAYWREHYASRPYVRAGAAYDEYQPAYRFGWGGCSRYGELNWAQAEPQLHEDWRRAGGESRLAWEKASPAVRDAWARLRPDADYSSENI